MKQQTAIVIAGAIVGMVAAQSLGVFGGGAPSIVSPASVLLALPALLGAPLPIVVGGFVILFWLWSAPLGDGSTQVPRRTIALLLITALLSIVNFTLGWEFGVKYQGLTYAVVCLTLSASLLLICAVLLWRVRLRPSFNGTLFVHTLAFIWLASYAVPYLGETP